MVQCLSKGLLVVTYKKRLRHYIKEPLVTVNIDAASVHKIRILPTLVSKISLPSARSAHAASASVANSVIKNSVVQRQQSSLCSLAASPPVGHMFLHRPGARSSVHPQSGACVK